MSLLRGQDSFLCVHLSLSTSEDHMDFPLGTCCLGDHPGAWQQSLFMSCGVSQEQNKSPVLTLPSRPLPPATSLTEIGHCLSPSQNCSPESVGMAAAFAADVVLLPGTSSLQGPDTPTLPEMGSSICPEHELLAPELSTPTPTANLETWLSFSSLSPSHLPN